jgi:tetratricopeptide (TPR) repeat protein
MHTYPLMLQDRFSYADYLQYNRFVSDPAVGVVQATAPGVKARSIFMRLIAETLEKNAGFLAATITPEAVRIAEDTADPERIVEYPKSRAAGGVAALGAEFDIAAGLSLLPFDFMREGMQAAFHHIDEILRHRRKAGTRNRFLEGVAQFAAGCRQTDQPEAFTAAVELLEASLADFSENPVAHLHLGHIKHYVPRQTDREAALSHYMRCAETGDFAGESGGEFNGPTRCVAAMGCFYAGWLQAAVFGDRPAAREITQKAVRLDPSLTEASYHLAKLAALEDDAASAVNLLESTLMRDRYYAVKAGGDPDFNGIREEVNRFFQRLRDQTEQEMKDALEQLETVVHIDDEGLIEELRIAYREAASLVKPGTWFELTGAAPGFRDRIAAYQTLFGKARALEASIEQTIEEARAAENAAATPKTDREVIRADPSHRPTQDHAKKEVTQAEKGLFDEAEAEYRREQGLCLVCGEPVGFLTKLRGGLYCKKHRSSE